MARVTTRAPYNVRCSYSAIAADFLADHHVYTVFEQLMTLPIRFLYRSDFRPTAGVRSIKIEPRYSDMRPPLKDFFEKKTANNMCEK